MEILKPTFIDQATFSGSVNISGSLTINQNLNVVGELQGAATTASYISLANVDGFTDVSASLVQNIDTRLLNTTDTLDGDLTVTGKITAQEFHTEFVSASIIYQSGSTQFGDSADDVHSFTGTGSFDKVGIGTTTPSTGLHVKDTYVHFQASNAFIQMSDFGNSMYLKMDNTGSLDITNGSQSPLVSFKQSGKVGIGNTSPTAQLDVSSGTTNTVAAFRSTDAGAYVGFADNTSTLDAGYPTTSVGAIGDNLILSSANAERMRIDSSGNVGIGVTPANWNTVTPVIQLGYTAFSAYQNVQATYTSNAYYNNGWRYIGDGTATYYSHNEASPGVHAWYSAPAGNAGNFFSFSERMRIDASGNVGIGTSSPGQKLDIRGASSSDAFVIVTGGAGTTKGGLYLGNNGTQYASLWFDNSNNDVVLSQNYATGNLIFRTNSIEKMRIASGGDVSIGTSTTAQSAKLNVFGSITTIHNGVDGNYKNSFISVYSSNYNEHNVIRTAVSSVAQSSGFQFMVSNGGGSSSTTESFRINRGSCTVIGSLSKGSGSFKIDHPLNSKKDTHNLVHSFVESPQANNIYRGKVQLVNGRATVNLDEVSTMTEGTFVALNRDIHTYTSNESDWDAVRGKVEGNILTIECQNTNSTATVSWLVIGERQDKHMYDTDWTDENGKVIVEPEKTPID